MLSVVMLNVVMLSVGASTMLSVYLHCRYTKCSRAECRGAFFWHAFEEFEMGSCFSKLIEKTIRLKTEKQLSPIYMSDQNSQISQLDAISN